MLVFIVPLKSIRVSSSWKRVSQLFERCIKSICNQTSRDFRVIVVCHEMPPITFKHPQLNYIEVNFLPPQSLDIAPKMVDRFRKVMLGLKTAKQFEPTHVMAVDADDCVSKYLAEFVAQHPQSDGWYFDRGYEYRERSKFIYFRKNNFYLHSGTSNIIRYDLCQFPENPEAVELEKLKPYSIPHHKIRKVMDKRGALIEPLPFPGSVYVIQNGENTEPRKRSFVEALHNPKEATFIFKEVYKKLNSKPLTETLRDEFGLYAISI